MVIQTHCKCAFTYMVIQTYYKCLFTYVFIRTRVKNVSLHTCSFVRVFAQHENVRSHQVESTRFKMIRSFKRITNVSSRTCAPHINNATHLDVLLGPIFQSFTHVTCIFKAAKHHIRGKCDVVQRAFSFERMC